MKKQYCRTADGIARYNLNGPSSGLRFIYALGRDNMCGNCQLKNDCRYGLPCKERSDGKGHDFHGEFGDYDCRYCSLYFTFDNIGTKKSP